MIKDRNVSVIYDENEKAIVIINDKKFKGLNRNDWKVIEQYLMGYIGDCYEIVACSEKIYISKDFPDEYSNSESRIALKGARRKAKADAIQGIPEMIEIAIPQEPNWEPNREEKHNESAKNGWYRYYVRFGLPVYNDKNSNLEYYNIFSATMLVRHAEDGKKYLYDLTTIKKETSSPLKS